MEPVRQLFSRGASPTPSVSLSSFAAADVDPPVHHSPAASIRSHGAGGSVGQASGAATSPQSRVEALFANMTPPNAPPTTSSTMTNAGNNNANHSGAGTPVSVANQSVHSATSDSNSRANALLSLLSPGPAQAPMPQATPPQPPAPENAGRMLLEQLMGGSGGPRTFVPPAVTGLAAHYPPSPYPPMSSNYYDPVPPPMPVQPAPQPEPVQSPPSPPKSMFDFVSPFDALGPAPASAGSNKVSPEPPSSAGITSSLTDAPPAWADPKRKSVDNLLEQLTRSTVPNAPIPPVQQDDPEAQLATANKSQNQGRPLPPKPQGQQGSPRVTQLHAQGSPRASPPKQSAVARARQVESPSGLAGSQREKDESPGPRGQGWKNRGKKNGASAISNNIISNAPASPGQSLALDMSLPLEEIRVPEGSSATVPIALVKMDEAFAPGTTIGATAWIAYAMSKGRVRIISRASGERTLLQLPECFNYPTNIVDVAVHGHRIAVVTQDGGLVVWEMPEIIADDVPGRIIVCVLPQTGPDALRLVKWHTHDPDTLAVASSRSVYTLHVPELDRLYSGQLVEQAELARAVPPLYPTEHSSPVEPIPKIAALEFVPAHAALTVLLDDGTLSYYAHSPASRGGPSTTVPTPFHTTRIPPPASVGAIASPCSLTAAGGALVLGRAQNTSLQILGASGRGVLATIRFTLPSEPASFVRLSFEPRARVLWAAHSKRAGLWAIRLGPAVDGEGYGFGGEAGAIVQVAEFPVKTPVLDLVALAPPEGENAEAAAACHAAKVPPGPVALVAFVQHVTGVDQVVIRGDWWAAALAGTREKLPYTASSVPSGNAPLGSSTMSSQPLPPQVPMQAQSQVQVPLQASSVQQTPTRETRRERAERERVERETAHIAQPSPVGAPARVRTPEDEPEAAPVQSSSSTQQDGPRGRGGKGKGVSKPQERERERKKDDDKESGKENSELSRELKKLEEALHLRVARHVTRELERQHAWLADVRAADKDDAMRYQSMLLDAVSNELTKNTTALFDTAVRAEVRNGVLPLLEDVVRAEVARGVGKQVAAGVSDSVNKTLPPEIERLLVRPDVSAHVARTFSQTVSPLIERHVKDAITHTLVPTYTAQTSALHEALAREMQAEMLALRKEVIAWQSDALRSHEGALRELEGTVRALSDQIRALAPLQQRPPPQQTQQQQQYAPPSQPPPPPHGQPQYAPPPPPQQLHQQYGPPPQQMQQMQPAWFPPQSLPAPQASHPAVPPPAHHSPPLSNAVGQAPDPDGWDETYMNVLQSQDARALRELLARSPPDALMPLSPNAPSPLSQVVLLSLVHRLATGLNEMAPEGEAFQGNLWWLRRAAGKLNAEDVTIKPYAARVLPGVQSGLGVLRTRIGLLPPGVGVQDASRAVGEVADLIGRKVQ
ncbi:hypothetical protein PENSPDRAFT_588327 [Peniophora sp. CONT]|nr:hypothetical protein PENSPDRAFT_588327 [Peniophora sp. CONT]